MKKQLVFLSFLFMLAGCSAFNEQGSGTAQQPEAATELQKEPAKEKWDGSKYTNNPQATDDSTLEKVGQSHRDEDGKLTLEGIVAVDKTVQIGPVEFKVKQAKLLHYVPSYDLIDFFHTYTDEEEAFDYIKLEVEMRNTSDEPVLFSPAGVLRTNSGQEWTWEDDFYMEELNGELDSGGRKYGDLGFIIEESENLQHVTIQTSDVLSADDSVIAPSEEISISF